MDPARTHSLLLAIAEHLDANGATAHPANNIPALRELGHPALRHALEHLETDGLIHTHEGPRKAAGQTYFVALTDHGRAMIQHPPAAESAAGPVAEQWNARDFPVLKLLARAEQQRTDASVDEITELTGLPYPEIRSTVDLLKRSGLVDEAKFSAASGRAFTHVRLSADGLRKVRAWPTEEVAVDRMLAALDRLIATAPDQPTRTKRQEALAQLGGLGRDTLAAVAATVITGQLPS